MKYKVTCKGMFISGKLHRLGDVFEMDDDNVQKIRDRMPHLTFEAVNDEAKRDNASGRSDGSDSGEATARLSRGRGKGKGAKKRGG